MTEVWNRGINGAEDGGGGGDIITEAETWRGGTDGGEAIDGGEKLLLEVTDGVVLRVGGAGVGGAVVGGAAGITVLT